MTHGLSIRATKMVASTKNCLLLKLIQTAPSMKNFLQIMCRLETGWKQFKWYIAFHQHLGLEASSGLSSWGRHYHLIGYHVLTVLAVAHGRHGSYPHDWFTDTWLMLFG